MITVIVIKDNEIVVTSAEWIDETDIMVCIHLSSRFGNHTVTFEGFSGVFSQYKIVIVVDGVITVRFTNSALSSGTLINTRLILLAFGHGHGCRGNSQKDFSAIPGKFMR